MGVSDQMKLSKAFSLSFLVNSLCVTGAQQAQQSPPPPNTGTSSGGVAAANNNVALTSTSTSTSTTLIEPGPCIAPTDPRVIAYLANTKHKTYMNYDSRCDNPATNCPTGCCRYHPYVMICDSTNEYAQQQV